MVSLPSWLRCCSRNWTKRCCAQIKSTTSGTQQMPYMTVASHAQIKAQQHNLRAINLCQQLGNKLLLRCTRLSEFQSLGRAMDSENEGNLAQQRPPMTH